MHLHSKALAALGVTLDSAAKIPDVIVHYRAKNWLLLVEPVTSAGPVVHEKIDLELVTWLVIKEAQ